VFCLGLELHVFVRITGEWFRRIAQLYCDTLHQFDFHAGSYLDSLLKHKCVLYAARLTDSQCTSCSCVTDGTHTSFIVTVDGLDEAPVGPASSCRAQCVYSALKQMEVFYRLFLVSYVTDIHEDD
jgi:hypothetical protein